MNTNITADSAKSLTTRALVISKALLQDSYVQMTDAYNRHGWAAGPDAYNKEKLQISDTLEIITKELHARYLKEQALQAVLDTARAEVHAAVVEAAA